MRLASTNAELRLFRRIELGEICMRLQRLMFLAAEEFAQLRRERPPGQVL